METSGEVIQLDKSKHVLGIPEAAAILGIGESTAYRLLKEGTFPVETVLVGRRRKVPRRALEEFLSIEEAAS
jgi:excisionase family DNA binding protein